MPDGPTIPTRSYGEFSRRIHEQAADHDQVIKAQLELTYRCNLRCRHCYTDPYNNRDDIRHELTTTEIERLLVEMRDLGIIWLNLTGGDIFMHPQFFDIYESAYRKGFLLQLYTNGTLFTRTIVERLERMPPFTIDVSVHSVNEARFDWFTQVPGSFRAFLRGVELMRQSSLPLTFKTKLMNWNRGEVADLQRFVESCGQPFGYSSSLSPRLNGDCAPLDYRLAPEELAELEGLGAPLTTGEAACSALRSDATGTDRLFRCGCGTDTIHISAWGELGTCTLQYEHRASLRQYSLREAIQRVFAATRAAHYSPESPCRRCHVLEFCDKKPSDARWEYGSSDAPIPYDCDIAVRRASAASGLRLIHPLRRQDREKAPIS